MLNELPKQLDTAEARKSLLSGGMMQWLVLVNGLILTIVLFVTSTYFVGRTIDTDYGRAIGDTQQAVSERLIDLEYTIRTSAALVADWRDPGNAFPQNRLQYTVPHLKMLDRLLWLRMIDGQWRLDELYRNAESPNSALIPRNAEPALIQALLADVTGSRSEMVFMPDLPGTQYNTENDNPLTRARPFAIARPLKDTDGQIVSVVVGLSRASAVLNDGWLSGKENIRRILVRDQASGRPLFLLDRDAHNDGRSDRREDGAATGQSFRIQIGGGAWELFLTIGKYRGASLLEKMPFLLLVGGVIFTLGGAWYSRNHQSQSLRLATMNRTLAQKNYELSSEMSERERLNQTLVKAEREYRAIVDSVSDVIFETNMEGEIIFLNSAWERITGFDIEHGKGRNIFDMLHPQDQEEQRQNFRDLIRGKRGAARAFTRLRTRDGIFRSVEMAMSMLRQDENRKLRVVGSFTDVEERRRAERALSEAEKKYRTIVENAAGGIFQMTPEGQILSGNPAMARILGFETVDQMLRDVRNGLDFLFVAPRDRSRFLREMTHGQVKNMEVQGVNRQHQRLWMNINARGVQDEDGNVLYFEGSVENINQRKAAELDLREAKIKSDLASRAKSEFLANMSHELRTPLNAIIGFSEIMKNEVLGNIENKQYLDYSKDIYESGRNLLKIINDILDVSRIEAGDRQLNDSTVNVGKVVASCLGLMQARIDEGHLTVTNLIDGTTPQIVGEELAVKQITLNLLSNAVKFTPDGGRVTISSDVDLDGQFLLSISDTGIGLDETEIEKALSPFGQIDTALSRSGNGAGLGLTLVDSLIKLHGGRLELFSQKGIGTTATVIFPAQRVVQQAGSSRAEAGNRPESTVTEKLQ